MLEKNFVVGALQCNCRLLACPNTGDAVLIDPGDESERLLQELSHMRTPAGLPIRVRYLLHTHGHFDHIGATRSVCEGLSQCQMGSPKIALHPGDESLYQNLQLQGGLFGVQYEAPLPIDHFLEDEEELQIGSFRLSMIHTPGHSPGSVCIRLHEDTELGIRETVFSGDTLFFQSVGRTDLWGGNADLLMRSIHNRLLVLDDDTRVCPGHGQETSLGREKRKNPFLQR